MRLRLLGLTIPYPIYAKDTILESKMTAPVQGFKWR